MIWRPMACGTPPPGRVGASLHLEHARAQPGSAMPTRPVRTSGSRTPPGAGYSDDLLEIGGEEFALSEAATCSMAGGALAETAGAEREAAGELETRHQPVR